MVSNPIRTTCDVLTWIPPAVVSMHPGIQLTDRLHDTAATEQSKAKRRDAPPSASSRVDCNPSPHALSRQPRQRGRVSPGPESHVTTNRSVSSSVVGGVLIAT